MNRAMLLWHLEFNFYPGLTPTEEGLQAIKEAIEACQRGEDDLLLMERDGEEVTAREIVQDFRLEGFVEGGVQLEL